MSVDPKSLKSPFGESISYNAAVRCEALFTKLNPDSKKQAIDLVNSMQNIYSGTDKTGFAEVTDFESKLLNILKYDESYMKAHSSADGNPDALITDANDVNGTITKIKEYKKFVDGIPKISLENFFENYFLDIYNEFQSSDTYIRRLVNNILTDYNNTHTPKYNTANESTRLLIAKRFIEQFGYFDVFRIDEELKNSSLSKKFDSSALKKYVESNYGGDFMQMDESVFDNIDNITEAKEYLRKVAHLIGAIRYKAPFTVVNKKMCEQLCEIIKSDKLSDSAKNSTAFFLSECFNEDNPHKNITADWLQHKSKSECMKICTYLNKSIRSSIDNPEKALTIEHFTPQEILYILIKKFPKTTIDNKLDYNESDYSESELKELKQQELNRQEEIYIKLNKYFEEHPSRRNGVKLEDIINPKEIKLENCGISDVDAIAEALLNKTKPSKTKFLKHAEQIITELRTCEKHSEYDNYFTKAENIIKEINDIPNDAQKGIFIEKIELTECFSAQEILYVMLKGISTTICPVDVHEKLYEAFKNNTAKAEWKTKKLESIFKEFDRIKFDDCNIPDVAYISEQLLKSSNGPKDTQFKEIAHEEEHKHKFETFEKISSTSYNRFPYTVRFVTLIDKYSNKIPAKNELIKRLNSIHSLSIKTIHSRKNALKLDELIKDQKNQLKSLRDYGDPDPELERFVKTVEELLSKKAHFADDYFEDLKQKINDRYTEGTKPKSSIYRYAAKTLCKNTPGFKLLEIANAIANSKFSGQNESSREHLYLFALAFGMRYDRSHSTMPGFYDVERNLFEDYYCDNLINDLSAATNPISGHGINYKNFAEVTFLWGLHRLGADKPASEILREIYRVISYCKKHGKTYAEFKRTKPDSGILNNAALTGKYKNNFEVDKIVNMDEDKLKEYNITHYACRTNGNYFGINSDNRTAKSVGNKHLEKFLEFYYLDDAARLKNFTCNSYFDMTDKFLSNISDDEGANLIIQKITKRLKIFSDKTFASVGVSSKSTDDDDFISWLSSYISNVIESFYNVASPDDRYFYPKRLELSYYSRTSIIALCFYMYMFACNVDKEDESPQLTNSPTLEKIYNTFAENKDAMEKLFGYPGANTILREAGYQEINPKNIYDMYIIFIIYSSIHPY